MSYLSENRRYNFVINLSSILAVKGSSFNTLNSSTPEIIACNPNSLNQLISESYDHIFIFDMSLNDAIISSSSSTYAAPRTRIISNPYIQFPYRVNVSDYPSIAFMASDPTCRGNLPIPSPSPSNQSDLRNILIGPSGYSEAVSSICRSCFANGFKFNITFVPHIFTSKFNFQYDFTKSAHPFRCITGSMLDRNNRVIFISAFQDISPQSGPTITLLP